MSGFTEESLLELFDKYDSNANGSLDYKEFVGTLYGNESLAKNAKEPTNKGGKPAFQKPEYEE